MNPYESAALRPKLQTLLTATAFAAHDQPFYGVVRDPVRLRRDLHEIALEAIALGAQAATATARADLAEAEVIRLRSALSMLGADAEVARSREVFEQAGNLLMAMK
jgi:hypothetical protein